MPATPLACAPTEWAIASRAARAWGTVAVGVRLPTGPARSTAWFWTVRPSGPMNWAVCR